ncbi:hypothetical protein AB0I98_36865 [Streptomyces sp. NPDC050211]|uniref:hypothetical protein n=1 Tax=Streptomyces sp. NPDC050211 TaxID=3154932 RepID=UPI00342A1376
MAATAGVAVLFVAAVLLGMLWFSPDNTAAEGTQPDPSPGNSTPATASPLASSTSPTTSPSPTAEPSDSQEQRDDEKAELEKRYEARQDEEGDEDD